MTLFEPVVSQLFSDPAGLVFPVFPVLDSGADEEPGDDDRYPEMVPLGLQCCTDEERDRPYRIDHEATLLAGRGA